MRLFITVALATSASWAAATDHTVGGLRIQKIRAVGDYQGATFDGTIELWFTTSLGWPVGSRCTDAYRVHVDSRHRQVVAAAYLALSTGKQVAINVDDMLPIRSGSCEVSFIDVMDQ